MPDPDGLMITGHDDEATCVACNKAKECLYLESTDGNFQGWVCFTHLKPILRLRLAHRPRPDRGAPLFDPAGHNDRGGGRA